MGEAIQNVGKVAREIDDRIKKTETDQQLVKAEIDARTRLDRLKYDLEADAETPDAAIPARWRQESEAILKEVGQTIGSENARNLWMTRAKGWQGEGENWSVGLSRKRSVEKVRGQHITNITDLTTTAGDMAISAETFAAKQAAVLAGIKSSAALNMVGADDVARYEADIAAAGVKDRTIRFTSNLDALMKDGRVAEAEALYQAQMGMNREGKSTVDPDTLVKVKSGLEQSKQDFEVVAKADRFWAASKGDYGRYMEMVSGVQDVPQRLKLEERGAKLANQAKAAEDTRQDGLERAMWEHVNQGGTIMNASPSLRASINPDRLGSIRAFENARDAEKGMTTAQKTAWIDQSADSKAGIEWFARNSPALFMGKMDAWPENIRNAYVNMTPDDQRAIATKQLEMADTGRTSDAVDKVMQDAVNEAKRFAPSIMATGKDNDAKRMQFEGILYRNARLLSAQQGGTPVTPEQSRKLVLQAMAEFDAKKYGAGVNVALGYMQADEAAASDPTLWARIAQQQEAKLGRKPSRIEVLQAYQAVVGD